MEKESQQEHSSILQQDKPSSINEKNEPPHFDIWKIYVSSVIIGLVFGFALQKATVTVPYVIINQFLMKDFTMIKTFLSAATISQLVLMAFNLQPKLREEYWKPVREKHLGGRGLFSSTLGAVLVGIGMALSGSCPGTVFPQMGSGVIWAFGTFAGCIIGSIFFTLVEPKVIPLYRIWEPQTKKAAIDLLFGVKAWIINFAFAVACVVCVILFEYFFPYQGGRSIESVSWPPQVAGALIGILQVPALFFLGKTIGSSHGYAIITSYLLYPFYRNRESSKVKHTVEAGKMNWWQPLYLLGAVLGGVISSLAFNSYAWNIDPAATSLGPISILGGFIMVFGARMSGGCTSGHGISGMALLEFNSILAVPAMFGGGIATAFILYYANVYPSYVYNHY